LIRRQPEFSPITFCIGKFDAHVSLGGYVEVGVVGKGDASALSEIQLLLSKIEQTRNLNESSLSNPAFRPRFSGQHDDHTRAENSVGDL